MQGRSSRYFYLFHRSRTWNEVERTWMGYERKRGKLEQFNALLRGQASGVGHEGPSFTEIVGDTSILPSIACVITLDTDTQLVPGSGVGRRRSASKAAPLIKKPGVQ